MTADSRDGRATPTELDAMRRAIALSGLGLATTSPNPPVGCVILDPADRIVGEGYHERKGEPHAEAQALAAAGERVAGGTAVVTLEPCCHHGRTPPCHQALIDAGVRRVVIAILDPTSRGDGGAAQLRAAGVSVAVGVLAGEAQLVLRPWLEALRTGRPQVTWAYHLGPAGLSPAPDELVDRSGLRALFDAVLLADGSLEEGISASHGRGAFSLPPVDVFQGTAAFLTALYAAGTRSLLVHGGAELARPFLDTGAIDRVRVFLSSPASSRPEVDPPAGWTLLPASFEIQRVDKIASAVVVDAVRGGDHIGGPPI